LDGGKNNGNCFKNHIASRKAGIFAMKLPEMSDHWSEYLEQLPEKARSKKRDFKQAALKLRAMKGRQADALVSQLHGKAFEKINCLECANCCKSLGPRLLRSDIDRLAACLKMKTAAFELAYLRRDEDGDMVFHSMPCPFLMPDNHCMVYDHRPRACREYPHTDQRNIRSILSLCVKNTETCPAVFQIFDNIP
jgi:uncharacterized protein